MVQIRRVASNQSLAKRCRRRLVRFLRSLIMAAVIPLVFVLKYYYFGSSTTTVAGRLRISNESILGDARFQKYIRFLENLDYSTVYNLHNSDVVELFHCDLKSVNWTDFFVMIDPLLNEAMEALRSPLLQAIDGGDTNAAVKDMQEEFLLELLEQYVTVHGFCDYSQYRPSVTNHDKEGALLAAGNGAKRDAYRLAIIISAYQDAEQLVELVAAIHQVQHYIVIHLERQFPTDYRRAVEDAVAYYQNVVIVQFGTVVYRTDSLSMINLRILRWITVDLNLKYEHAVLIDGSAFPLTSAEGLTLALKQAKHRSVWLGELTHKGQRVSADQSPADHLLKQKRLIFTRNNNTIKLHKRLPKHVWTADDNGLQRRIVPDSISDHMVHKSTSGNQGIYSRTIILKLLNSDAVMELFALSKYGCCCCLEERNWIAALSIIGFGEEALEQTSMFQVWGGQSVCGGTMNNAVLSTNASLCFRSEDPGRNVTDLYFHGDEMWDYLVDAKRRGYLFARKFRTDNEDSMDLMSEIRSKLWNRL